MDPTATAKLVNEFGLAQGLLIAILCGLAGVTVWLGIWVVLPLTRRIIKFLDDLSASIANQSAALQVMATSRNKDITRLDNITERLEKMFYQQDAMIVQMTRMYDRYGERHTDALKGGGE